MSPKTRDPDARREAILSAAHELFSIHGLRGTRLEDVARRARVSKGSLYDLAPNKLELFFLVCERQLESEFERMEAALAATKDPIDRLRTLLQSVMPTHRQAPGVYAMIFELQTLALREKALTEKVADLYRWHFTRFRKPVMKIIADGIARNIFRDDLQPVDAAITMEAWVFFKWFEWITFPEMTVAELKKSSLQWIDNVLLLISPVQNE